MMPYQDLQSSWELDKMRTDDLRRILFILGGKDLANTKTKLLKLNIENN